MFREGNLEFINNAIYRSRLGRNIFEVRFLRKRILGKIIRHEKIIITPHQFFPDK